ncbi:MAG: hypothetical protein ACRDRH_10355 [Pseudonocardia sp.]
MLGAPVELVEVAREELIDRRGRARVALLGDLVEEPVEDLLRLAAGVRAGRDDLNQVVALLRHRVDAGVHAHPQGAATQRADVAPRAGLVGRWTPRHAAKDTASCGTSRGTRSAPERALST